MIFFSNSTNKFLENNEWILILQNQLGSLNILYEIKCSRLEKLCFCSERSWKCPLTNY